MLIIKNVSIVLVSLVMVVSLAVVSGCSSEQPTTTTTSQPTTSTTTTTTPTTATTQQTTTTTVPATTTTTGPRPVFQGMYSYEDFNTPDTCGGCHQRNYTDWSNALMSVSYDNPWKQVEYFQLAYPHSQQLEKVAGVESGCIMCHGPLAFLSDDIPPSPASEGTRANEGVSCEICHSITGTTEEQSFNFSAIMDLGDTKYGPRDDSVSPFHDTQFSAFTGSREHCALCHDEQSPYGAWVKATYREWLEGPFPGQNITCINCHMDTDSGTAAVGGKERDDLAIHTFQAVHTPERLEDDIEIVASVDSQQAIVGETINITAELRALSMGHKFPSGSAEERMLWLEVWATDSQGHRYHLPVDAKGFDMEEYTIADSTALAYSDIGEVMGIQGFAGLPRDGDAPDGARIFRQPYFNPDGEMSILQWYCADNTSVDYRFDPRDTRAETYTWTLPAGIAPGPLTLDFTMYYSLVPSSVGEYLGLDEFYYTPFVTGIDSLTINVGEEPPPTTTTTTPAVFTFGQLAVEGKDAHETCKNCHSSWVGSSAKDTLANYGDAKSLMYIIIGMPGGLQYSEEILSYILVEQGWVSEDDNFDLDTLGQIQLN